MGTGVSGAVAVPRPAPPPRAGGRVADRRHLRQAHRQAHRLSGAAGASGSGLAFLKRNVLTLVQERSNPACA